MQDLPNVSALGMVVYIGFTFLAAPFALLSLALPYMVLRLRHDNVDDRELGTKIGLQYFFSLGIMTVILGITIIAVDVITTEDKPALNARGFGQPNARGFGQPQFNNMNNLNDDDEFNPAQRTGAGMVVSGILLSSIYFVLARTLTNRDNWQRVRHTFIGWRFAIIGIVLAFTSIGLIIQLMQKDPLGLPNLKTFEFLIAVIAVWFPCWLIHVFLLRSAKRLPRTTAAVEIAPEPLV